MSFFTTVILLITVFQKVCYADVFRLKKEILDMQEYAQLLDSDNEELKKKLLNQKQECESVLLPLEVKQTKLHEQNLQKAEKITELSYSVIEKQSEESRLNDALQSAFIFNKKFVLQVELYSQELAILLRRKKHGLAAKCQLMQSHFDKYEVDLSLRSKRLGRTITTNKTEAIVLQNELNQIKVLVHAVLNKNKELNFELKSSSKLCKAKIDQMNTLLSKTTDDLLSTYDDLKMVQIEHDELVEVLKKLNEKLESTMASNEQLKNQVISLKKIYAAFGQDLACYRRASSLLITYQ